MCLFFRQLQQVASAAADLARSLIRHAKEAARSGNSMIYNSIFTSGMIVTKCLTHVNYHH